MRVWLAMILLVMAHTALAADAPSKYALFVGVTKYDHAEMNKSQLEYPEADAKELAKVFKDSGYEVDLLMGKEATQEVIKKKLSDLKKKGDSDGVVALGFFGIGVEYEDTKAPCFCPYDTRIRTVVDRQGRSLVADDGTPMTEPDPKSLVTMTDVLSGLRISPAGNRVVFMDCNRVQPHRARGKAFGDNPLISGLPDNTAVLFACSSHENSWEHQDWRHGAFVRCLIDELRAMIKAGQVTVGTLADRVQLKVKQLVGERKLVQTPQFVSTNVFDLQMTPGLSSAK